MSNHVGLSIGKAGKICQSVFSIVGLSRKTQRQSKLTCLFVCLVAFLDCELGALSKLVLVCTNLDGIFDQNIIKIIDQPSNRLKMNN